MDPEKERETRGHPSPEHLGLAIALLPGSVVAARLVRVSNADEATMRTLLQTIDVLPLVLGTLLPTFPMFVLIGLLLANVQIWRARSEMRSSAVWSFYVTLLAISGVFAVVLLPVSWLIGTILSLAAIVAIEVLYRKRVRRRGSQPLDPDIPGHLAAYISLLLLFPIFMSDWMWLPAEVVERDNGERVVAYVLNADEGGFATLFTESTRRVVRIPSDEIRSRQPCSIDKGNRPLATYLASERSRGDRSDRCPKIP